ncbi:MAG TPA: ABC transporter ATP-binding protein, partial [Bryobacteraceae bacterium]|nr:ABC transporter ATP-binding protein [Bryobacteraceae bacterium]
TPLPLKIAVDSAIGDHPLPVFVQRVLPQSLTGSHGAALGVAVGLLVLLAILTQLLNLAESLLRAYTSEKLILDFRALIFRHMQRISLSWHDKMGTADAIYRIQYDTASIQYISIDGFIPFVTSAVTLGAMLYITTRIDAELALVALAVSPILLLLSQTYRPRLREQSREIKHLEHSALAVIQEVMGAIRVVKAFGREDHEEGRYILRSAAGMRSRLQLALDQGCYGLFTGATTAIGATAVLWIGVQHVQAGSMTLGNLLLVMAYLAQLYGPLKTIGQKAGGLQGYLASAERVFSVLDRVREVPERLNPRPLVRATGAVQFCNVYFGYDPNCRVLHGISFDVPPGARVGIAGRTGAGKTTLISLLARFYDPDLGQILLDGVDIREYKLADLRNQLSIVLQEPVLFSTTISENIAYARPEASHEEIVAAAKLANAHDFIVNLPDGYETSVGERGMRLSGGERQRISLARAFLKDAPILVLDEPTSSVDLKTEAVIMEALERLMHGRTTFMIAHRTSTIENCDLRLELDRGRIVAFHSLARRVFEEGVRQ